MEETAKESVNETAEEITNENTNKVIEKSNEESDTQFIVESQETKDNVILDKIINNANVLYKFHKKQLKEEKYIKMSDNDKMIVCNEGFADFIKMFPVVTKYMICLNMYSTKAFRKYIIHRLKNSPKSPDDEIEQHSLYVMWLYEELGNHIEREKLYEIKAEAYRVLKQEQDELTKLYAKAKSIMEEEHKTRRNYNIEELKNIIKSIKN